MTTSPSRNAPRTNSSSTRRFQIALIKPSHYDDDGYVISWYRSFIPSNSLAVVYSLVADSRDCGALGDDVAIDITAADEINTRLNLPEIIERFRAHDNFGLVFMIGVQSNQFPRTMDIARPLRKAGVPVAIGGFHVSGCLAMLPGILSDLQEALDLGITLYAGELEGRCDSLLRDAANGSLKPIYQGLRHWMWIDVLRRKIRKDPDRLNYIDTAITPVNKNDTDELEMFTHSQAAQDAVQHARKIKELTTAKPVA